MKIKTYIEYIIRILIFTIVIVSPIFFAKLEIHDFTAIRYAAFVIFPLSVVLRMFKKRKLVDSAVEYGALLLIFVMALSIVGAGSEFLCMNQLFNYIAIIAIYYGLRTIDVQDEKLLDAVLLSMFLVAAAAIIQKIGIHIWRYRFFSPQRLTGTFFNANRLAGYLGLGLAPALYKIVINKSMLKKALWSLFAVMLFIVVLFTQSRGGLIFVYLSTILFLYFGFRKKVKLVWVYLLLVNIALFAVILISPYAGRLKNLNFSDNNSMQRVIIWKTALTIAKDKPVFGSGIGSFMTNFEHFRSVLSMKYILPGDTAYHAHNDYLQTLSETGIAGLSLILLGIVYLLKKANRNNLLRNALFSSILGILIYELIDFNLHILPTLIVFLIFSSILLKKSKTTPKTYSNTRIITIAGAVIVVSLLFLYLNFRIFFADSHFNKGNKLSSTSTSAAMKEYEKAVTLNPIYDYYHAFLGGTLITLNKPHKAIFHYRTAAKMYPYKMSYFANIGVIYYKLRMMNHSIDAFYRSRFAEAIKADPLMKLAVINEVAGRYDAAISNGELLISRYHDFSALASVINAYIKDGRPEEGQQYLKTLFLYYPEHSAEIVKTGLQLLPAPYAREFLLFIEKGDIHKNSKGVINSLAYYYFDKKEYAAALPYFVKTAEMYHDSNAFFQAGICEYYLDRREKSIAYFKQCLKLDPANTAAQKNIKMLSQPRP